MVDDLLTKSLEITRAMSTILHITGRSDWESAKRQGSYRGDTLDTEGFIHASTAAQVARTAAKFFAGRSDLVVLHIDPERLTSPLRYESATSESELFPHIHGPLNLEAVIAVKSIERQPDGTLGPDLASL